MKDISKNSFSTDKECTNIIAKDFLFVVKQLSQFHLQMETELYYKEISLCFSTFIITVLAHCHHFR